MRVLPPTAWFGCSGQFFPELPSFARSRRPLPLQVGYTPVWDAKHVAAREALGRAGSWALWETLSRARAPQPAGEVQSNPPSQPPLPAPLFATPQPSLRCLHVLGIAYWRGGGQSQWLARTFSGSGQPARHSSLTPAPTLALPWLHRRSEQLSACSPRCVCVRSTEWPPFARSRPTRIHLHRYQRSLPPPHVLPPLACPLCVHSGHATLARRRFVQCPALESHSPLLLALH